MLIGLNQHSSISLITLYHTLCTSTCADCDARATHISLLPDLERYCATCVPQHTSGVRQDLRDYGEGKRPPTREEDAMVVIEGRGELGCVEVGVLDRKGMGMRKDVEVRVVRDDALDGVKGLIWGSV